VVILSKTYHHPSGNYWAVESENFWKTRGDHFYFTEAVIACVFKKISEATARWYDEGERVERNRQQSQRPAI
jgi:hypothetical protein